MHSLEKWHSELWDAICTGRSELLVIFRSNGDVLKKNMIYDKLVTTSFPDAFANPDFKSITESTLPDGLIFRGYITFHSGDEFGISLESSIYRKGDEFFLCGGIDFLEMHSYSKMYYELNREISGLQHTLMKEKSALQQTHHQLQKLNAELSEANLTKDKFFSIIAHDLRSPFHGLIGLSEMLSDRDSGLTQQQYINYAGLIVKSAKGIYDLLENLLLWANFQRGSISFEAKVVDLYKSVLSVIDQMQISFSQKEILVETSVENNLMAFCDENMIKTVLRNLLSNAVKFSERGGKISVSSTQDEKTVSLSVRDSGIGISPEEQEKLFRLDVKLSKKGTEGEASTGLGLILCKEFLDKNNGKISVSSQPGSGTVFTITLPKPV